ncbi:MAG: NAD(P)/FAD-dependent oxidoreductase [Bacteroides sp.]|nr:NAD(P)/FAD-dependent oxidoreductase [Bacteroides sp.]
MKTIIVGGGAAGCFGAVFSARNGYETVVIEPNGRLGKKLGITGKGRCNITNACDRDGVIKNIPRNPAFLYSALSRYGTEDCMGFIESLGVPLKTERGGRVFPVSDKASDIVNALTKEIRRLGVKTVKDRAAEITAENGAVTGVKTSAGFYRADKVILATGGLSYPATGSTGDGYKMAEKLGHTVTELKPSLVPLETVQSCRPMAGLNVNNAVLTLYDNEKKKKAFSEQGEFTFESYGIGGPLTLSASSRMDKPAEGRYTAIIDFKPALDEKKLDLRLQREIAAVPAKTACDIVRTLLPEKLVPTMLETAGLARDKKAGDISARERQALSAALKSFRLDISSFRPVSEAIITDGGVSVKEIDPSDMQSKIIKGLHFAGEIIDVSGFTGGFNLQIAYSTARAAAE